MDLASKRVLLFGGEGFTGIHLKNYLLKYDYHIIDAKCDITDKDKLFSLIKDIKFDYLINLAAISFVAHGCDEDFYKVNTIGCENILKALEKSNKNPKKVILASSATVYGDQQSTTLDESLYPNPKNHYGLSKYAMEQVAKNYFEKFDIVVTRPFNYTGKFQEKHFLIPKIVSHFKEKKSVIELGNLDVIREFNDVEFVCEVYKRFLENDVKNQIVNIASERGIRLLEVIELMQEIAGYKIDIKINPSFVRKNEIKKLIGSNKKLFSLIGEVEQKSFKDTLKDMFES